MTTHPVPDPVALNKAIAEEVRVLLTRRKLTQKALEDPLGWSRAKVNRLMNAKQTWGPSELLAVCDYLDVDLAALLSTAKAAAKESGAKRALESMLTEQQQEEIDEARKKLRPNEESDEGGQENGREAQ